MKMVSLEKLRSLKRKKVNLILQFHLKNKKVLFDGNRIKLIKN